MTDIELEKRLARAVEELTPLVQAAGIKVEDDDSDARVRQWLDGDEPPLDWAGPGITSDEWFFITTLYGREGPGSQRKHIRKFWPLFVQEVGRDIRNFTTVSLENWDNLRHRWMETRLCRMANVLRQSGLTMEGHVAVLREIESKTTSDNLTPALDRIIRDHRNPSRYKTLSVFVRDCVKGNCFPIDSRVEKQLAKYELPVKVKGWSLVRLERRLVSLCLSMDLNPRKVARTFYWAPQNEAGGVEKAVKRFGAKRLMEAIGPGKIIEEMGLDWLISGLSPAQLNKLKERLK